MKLSEPDGARVFRGVRFPRRCLGVDERMCGTTIIGRIRGGNAGAAQSRVACVADEHIFLYICFNEREFYNPIYIRIIL